MAPLFSIFDFFFCQYSYMVITVSHGPKNIKWKVLDIINYNF